MASPGLLLLGLAVITLLWPKIITIPLSVIVAWVAVSLFVRAYKLHIKGYEYPGALEERARPAKASSSRHKGREIGRKLVVCCS